MNNKIKEVIKKNIGNQVIEQKNECENCNEETTVEIRFSEDIVKCKSCNTEYPIKDESYEIMFKELQKLGVQIL